MPWYKTEPERDKWGKCAGDIIDELLKERGVNVYATFGDHDEGGPMPTGIYNWSTLVLTPDGKLWDYFLDWDPEKINSDGEKGYYKLREPRERSSEYFKSDPYYLRARKQMNLPLTEDQEHILRKWEEEHSQG
jgi:hypothetical protein